MFPITSSKQARRTKVRFIPIFTQYNIDTRLREANNNLQPQKNNIQLLKRRKELTTMKKQNEYKINHIEMTITLTKKFNKNAGIINSIEYGILKQLRADYPDYTICLREIAKKENKNSYRNLTYASMKRHIVIFEGEGSENIRNLEKTIELSKGQPGHYAYVKAWFLKNYPNYNEIPADMFEMA